MDKIESRSSELVSDDKSGIVYLACPFSHPEARVRHERFMAVTKKTAELIGEGYVVYSPITSAYPLTLLKDGLPSGWSFWKKFDERFILACSKMFVLKLEGWEGSVGLRAEIMFAEQHGIEIVYLEVD